MRKRVSDLHRFKFQYFDIRDNELHTVFSAGGLTYNEAVLDFFCSYYEKSLGRGSVEHIGSFSFPRYSSELRGDSLEVFQKMNFTPLI